jgi:hypothetical protein
MAKLPVVKAPSVPVNRREFVTGTAALILSGAALAGCDEAASLDRWAAEPGPGEPPSPELEPDDVRALRAYE